MTRGINKTILLGCQEFFIRSAVHQEI